MVKGKDMDLMCDRMFVYSEDDEVERIDAEGNVRSCRKARLLKVSGQYIILRKKGSS